MYSITIQSLNGTLQTPFICWTRPIVILAPTGSSSSSCGELDGASSVDLLHWTATNRPH